MQRIAKTLPAVNRPPIHIWNPIDFDPADKPRLI
jgi:hypothetical protein